LICAAPTSMPSHHLPPHPPYQYLHAKATGTVFDEEAVAAARAGDEGVDGSAGSNRLPRQELMNVSSLPRRMTAAICRRLIQLVRPRALCSSATWIHSANCLRPIARCPPSLRLAGSPCVPLLFSPCPTIFPIATLDLLAMIFASFNWEYF
jgi:hypothetical protein